MYFHFLFATAIYFFKHMSYVWINRMRMGKRSYLLSFKRSVTFLTTTRRNVSFQWHSPLTTHWDTSSRGVDTRKKLSSRLQKSDMAPIVQRWLCQTFWSSLKREQQLLFSSSRYVCFFFLELVWVH